MATVRDTPETTPYVLPDTRLTVRTVALYDLLNWAVAVALLSASIAGGCLWLGVQHASAPLLDSVVLATLVVAGGCAPLVDVLRELRARRAARPL